LNPNFKNTKEYIEKAKKKLNSVGNASIFNTKSNVLMR